MDSIKKFYGLLIVLTTLTALLLIVVFNRSRNIQTETAAKPLIEPGYQEIDLTGGLPPIGNPGGELIVAGWFDFNEERDRLAVKDLLDAASDRPQNLQIYLKNFPQPKLFSRDSTLPHRALLCAAAQNQYRAFLEKGLTNVTKPTELTLTQAATAVGLNQTTWRNCLNSPATIQLILDDVNQAQQLNLKSTPALFVNNKKINLENDVDIKDLLEKLLAV